MITIRSAKANSKSFRFIVCAVHFGPVRKQLGGPLAYILWAGVSSTGRCKTWAFMLLDLSQPADAQMLCDPILLSAQ